MRWRVAVGSAVGVAMVFAGSGTASGVAGFGDVDSGLFYTEAVQWMVDKDITTGTSPTCFSPDDPVTRGQAAAFLWRMEGSPADAPAHPFTDVTAPWQQSPVSWMYAEDITTGTSPTTYSPDDTLTRGQMAALIWRAAGKPPAAPATFPDVFKPWQIVPVGWMEAEEITTGTSPTVGTGSSMIPSDSRSRRFRDIFRSPGPPAPVEPRGATGISGHPRRRTSRSKRGSCSRRPATSKRPVCPSRRAPEPR